MTKIKKVLLAGITGVGKTSVVNVILNRSLEYAEGLSPTKGFDRTTFSVGNKLFSIWDSGGVLRYRQQVLREHYKVFSCLNELIYLFDIQNDELFSESLNYLRKIIKILDRFHSQQIRCYILFHKADPDVLESRQLRQNERTILTALEHFNLLFGFHYKILRTSIYYFHGTYSLNRLFSDERVGVGCLIEKLLTPNEFDFDHKLLN